ncbi:MAG: response regulator transcription factor [Desulfitobacteriaceae bacterium]|nr:response regulator transcription factor [Desulfitobacteriaceae bacterium]MDD4752477.1 response regulator transcription factor [Desulfitobacteriaceae bacterium]
MQRILVVDDEENIVQLIEYNLKKAGFETLSAYDGQKALRLIHKEKPDLVILDVMLPAMDGFDVVKELRKDSSIPILMLTARTEEFDRVLALELGADDYLTKPFSIRELVARVKAILRRVNPETKTEVKKIITAGPVSIDIERYQVFLNDIEVQLTVKEFELLKLLVQNKGRVFSREKLLEILWDYDYYGDTRTIDVHMRHLREKIEPDPGNPQNLITVRGVGYKFKE